MKKQILFIISMLLATSFWGTATNIADAPSADAQRSSNKIELKGTIKTQSGFRSGADPVVVELQGGNALLIRFQTDVGVVQATVSGPQGQAVYAATVNTEMPSAVTIPLAGLPAGKYTVSFSNERGVMWGEFEV